MFIVASTPCNVQSWATLERGEHVAACSSSHHPSTSPAPLSFFHCISLAVSLSHTLFFSLSHTTSLTPLLPLPPPTQGRTGVYLRPCTGPRGETLSEDVADPVGLLFSRDCAFLGTNCVRSLPRISSEQFLIRSQGIPGSAISSWIASVYYPRSRLISTFGIAGNTISS